jgi:hypothetical protein
MNARDLYARIRAAQMETALRQQSRPKWMRTRRDGYAARDAWRCAKRRAT